MMTHLVKHHPLSIHLTPEISIRYPDYGSFLKECPTCTKMIQSRSYNAHMEEYHGGRKRQR